LWLIPILLTVHNAEEAFAFRTCLPRMPALLPNALGNLQKSLSYPVMLGALALVSALAFLVTFAAVARPASRRLLWVVLVLEAAVGLNVFGHVVGAVTIFRGYGPGLASAVLINAPFAVYCFRRARREEWISPAALRATIPAALILHGPVLLAGLWLAVRVSR
jgi:hypothetical protein